MSIKKVIPRLPSGFKELLPSHQVIFEKFKRQISSTYESLGYIPLETSNLELTEVLLAKGGGETEKQVYSFTKGKNNLTLRYDLTVPLARYVSQNYSQLTFPFKRYQIQKVWRAEKAQKGRSREFYQCDVDILGNTSVVADADSVFAVYSALKSLNIPKFTISINNRKLVKEILSFLEVGEQSTEILRIIDKLSKIGKSSAIEQLNTLVKDREKSLKILDTFTLKGDFMKIESIIKECSLEGSEGATELQSLYNLLISMGIDPDYLEIDLSVVRGLDYYTSSVFETFIDIAVNYGSIASGGRYDDLVNYYSNQRLPGVGMSIGLTRLFEVLLELGTLPEVSAVSTRVLVCALSEEFNSLSAEILTKLRKENINSQVYLGKNLSLNKQLDYANKSKIPYVVILGEDEIKSGLVTIKNMESGEQKTINLEETISLLQS